ncbi:MAG: HDOD domain-containing protein [Methylococcaceae bacterium]
MSKIHSEELIAFVKTMPAFPKSVQKVVQLTSDINTSAKDIVQVIESDPVMTIKILKVINSSFYGLPHKTTSIQRAVVHIGLNTIKNLALTVAAIGVLNPKNKANFNTQQFLLHSLTTAALCRKLAERLDVSHAECSDFFVAGLLHDFGKIVFAEFDPDNFKKALEKSAQDNISLHITEIEFMGMNHAQAGKLLVEKWELDQSLISAIDHHHNDQHDNILKDCVFVANQISKKMQFGFAGNLIIEDFSNNIIARFGLPLDGLINDLGDLSSIKSDALLLLNS